MIKEIKKNRRMLKGLLGKVAATTSRGITLQCDEAIARTIDMIISRSTAGGKLIFIGNGASASIASHMATDFWKNLNIRALAFNDPTLLTCIGNDYGFEHVFEKPIKMFADSGDILIAISSSGKSKNILLGVKSAREKGAQVITFSGFKADNPLRQTGDINFYVPHSSYGHVEVTHLSLCHCIADIIKDNK